MQVEISDKARATLDSLMNDGSFDSEEAALDAAIELLAQRHAEWWETVAPLVEEGRRSIREGRYRVLTPENKDAFVAEIVTRGRERRQKAGIGVLTSHLMQKAIWTRSTNSCRS